MSYKFNIEDYNDRYFKWHYQNTKTYILDTMDCYIKKFNPLSIIDWGCGIGAYLESGYNNNIQHLKGIDIGGDTVKNYTPQHIIKYIEYTDCTLPLYFGEYECVISLETGEHIETSNSLQFVKNIINSKAKNGTIIFSAAQPGQKGTGHINCQPKTFWLDIFGTFGVNIDLNLTKEVIGYWEGLGAPQYLLNNLMILK